MAAPPPDGFKVLMRNKRARHDYFVESTLEAGIVLQGSEVKSLREAHAVMGDAYVHIRNGEAWLAQLQVTEYKWANRWNHAPKRERKLLLHRREIEKLDEVTAQKGYTVLPLEVYLKAGKIKVLLGVCKGKKQYDKRQEEKRKDATRDMDKALKQRR